MNTTSTSATTSRTTTPGRAWASLVLGILIFLVPFVMGATSANGDRSFAYSDYAVGVIVFVLGAISVWAARNSVRTLAWLEGINALLGVWTIIAPFVFVNDTSATWSNVVLGIVLVIVAAWDAYVGMTGLRGGTARRGRVA